MSNRTKAASTSTRFDAIVFDIDGTLLDSSQTVPATFVATIQEVSGIICTTDDVLAQYAARTAEELLERFIGRDATPDDIECWYRHFQRLMTKTHLYPGIPEMLCALGTRGATGYVYDRFQTGSDADRLNDADLLAPNLLNAPVQLKQFAALQSARDEIESRLRSIPQDLELSAASNADLTPLRWLFGVLDDLKASRSGVGAVIFSKVLHRKRPGVIPIIDINVLFCYQQHPTREASRIPFDATRTWADFVIMLASAMRDDLTAALDEWNRLTALTAPPLTRLRTLDIVAWRVGNHPPLAGEEDP